MQVLYRFKGIVQKGNKRGRTLGFPTVNVPVFSDIPEGIYISQIVVSHKTYPALTFIGVAKTYREMTYQSETYIFHFNRILYGQEVEIGLIKKIRDNKKFADPKSLIQAMEDDKKQAEAFFNISS